ncbi:MAG: hypothetical protein HZC36_12210 [Armatimonadetes bacterium]|nr:hypothetical protein [Armatimonadota bacterium]
MTKIRAYVFLALAAILAIFAFTSGDWLLMGPGVAIAAIIGVVMLFMKEPVKKEKVIKAEDTYKRKTIEL